MIDEKRILWSEVMDRVLIKLCPNCKGIMKSCCYAVGKQDGTERLENKIFSYDGAVILGKLVICTKCGHVSTVKA